MAGGRARRSHRREKGPSMTTEQRRALAKTIPTNEVIRDAVTFPRDRLGEPLDISPERFDAWLAQVRRDAAREALDGLIAEEEESFLRLHTTGAVMSSEACSHARFSAEEYRDTEYPEETP